MPVAMTPRAHPPQLLPSEGLALTSGKPGPGGDPARKADRPEASFALVRGVGSVGGPRWGSQVPPLGHSSDVTSYY